MRSEDNPVLRIKELLKMITAESVFVETVAQLNHEVIIFESSLNQDGLKVYNGYKGQDGWMVNYNLHVANSDDVKTFHVEVAGILGATYGHLILSPVRGSLTASQHEELSLAIKSAFFYAMYRSDTRNQYICEADGSSIWIPRESKKRNCDSISGKILFAGADNE